MTRAMPADKPRTTYLSWEGRSGSGHVPVNYSVYDAVTLMARHMAALHFELVWETSDKYRANIRGLGAAQAQHLDDTNPELWERFKGEAVAVLTAMHGTGEKGLPLDAPKDSRAYFNEMHDFAARIREE